MMKIGKNLSEATVSQSDVSQAMATAVQAPLQPFFVATILSLYDMTSFVSRKPVSFEHAVTRNARLPTWISCHIVQLPLMETQPKAP